MGGIGVGVVGLGRAAACEERRAESKLEAALVDFSNQVAHAEGLAERLARIANKVSSVEPPPGKPIAGNAPRPVESHLDRMSRLFSENAAAMEQIGHIVTRLDEAVG